PVHGFRREIDKLPLPRRQRGGKQPRVFAFENVLVVQNEGLIKLDEFLRSNQIPLSLGKRRFLQAQGCGHAIDTRDHGFLHGNRDRKSTRLNSSHVSISYAVFCLKKKRRYCPNLSRPRRPSPTSQS